MLGPFDAVNERTVRESLTLLAKTCTMLVIAHRHRLSTVRDADQVIVVDGGRVVECAFRPS